MMAGPAPARRSHANTHAERCIHAHGGAWLRRNVSCPRDQLGLADLDVEMSARRLYANGGGPRDGEYTDGLDMCGYSVVVWSLAPGGNGVPSLGRN